MRKLTCLFLLAFLVMSSTAAFASLNDNRAGIAAQYGEFRLGIDELGQLWTKAELEGASKKKAAPINAYVHQFRRQGLGFQLEVQYENEKPDSLVRSERITPDMGFKASELKDYLPEVYAMVTAPESYIFTTESVLTRNFRDATSPVTLGCVLKQPFARGSNTYYTQISFSIMDEGRYVRDAQFVTKDIYINEIVIERIFQQNLDPKTERERKDPIVISKKWKPMTTNPFVVPAAPAPATTPAPVKK